MSPCGVDWATFIVSSWMANLTDKDKVLLKHQLFHRFQSEDNKIDLLSVQPQFYGVRSS